MFVTNAADRVSANSLIRALGRDLSNANSAQNLRRTSPADGSSGAMIRISHPCRACACLFRSGTNYTLVSYKRKVAPANLSQTFFAAPAIASVSLMGPCKASELQTSVPKLGWIPWNRTHTIRVERVAIKSVVVDVVVIQPGAMLRFSFVQFIASAQDVGELSAQPIP